MAPPTTAVCCRCGIRQKRTYMRYVDGGKDWCCRSLEKCQRRRRPNQNNRPFYQGWAWNGQTLSRVRVRGDEHVPAASVTCSVCGSAAGPLTRVYANPDVFICVQRGACSTLAARNGTPTYRTQHASDAARVAYERSARTTIAPAEPPPAREADPFEGMACAVCGTDENERSRQTVVVCRDRAACTRALLRGEDNQCRRCGEAECSCAQGRLLPLSWSPLYQPSGLDALFVNGFAELNQGLDAISAEVYPHYADGVLQRLLIKDGRRQFTVTQRDATIAATLMQWLGRAHGFNFLTGTLQAGGYRVVRESEWAQLNEEMPRRVGQMQAEREERDREFEELAALRRQDLEAKEALEARVRELENELRAQRRTVPTLPARRPGRQL